MSQASKIQGFVHDVVEKLNSSPGVLEGHLAKMNDLIVGIRTELTQQVGEAGETALLLLLTATLWRSYSSLVIANFPVDGTGDALVKACWEISKQVEKNLVKRTYQPTGVA